MNDLTVRPIEWPAPMWPAPILLSRGAGAGDRPWHNTLCTADFGDLRITKLLSTPDLGRPQCLSWRQLWSGSAWA